MLSFHIPGFSSHVWTYYKDSGALAQVRVKAEVWSATVRPGQMACACRCGGLQITARCEKRSRALRQNPMHCMYCCCPPCAVLRWGQFVGLDSA